jgi:DNA polymerase III sliding clamp (beta) subunit (PCNA family)
MVEKIILREELMRALELLKPGLSKKDIVAQSSCFHFYPERIVTYNGVLSVQVPLQTGMNGAIRAEEFYGLMDKLPEKEVTFFQGNDEQGINEIQIVCGNVRAGLAVNEATFPPIHVESSFAPLPKDFKEALKFCRFSISIDMSTPRFTCVHINGMKVCSSDRYRITQFIMSEPSPFNLLLPGAAVEHIISHDFTHMTLDDNWVHFSIEERGAILSCKLVMEELIQADRFFEVEGEIIKFPSSLRQTVERAIIMADGEVIIDRSIKLTIQENIIKCRGQKEIGWVEEDLPIEYSGQPIIIYINPIFLLDILNKTNEAIVNERVCLFRGQNFQHVLALRTG